MTDVDAEVYKYLNQHPALGMAMGNIMAGAELPPGHDVSTKPTLLFSVRGGTLAESTLVLYPSMQFRCFGGTDTIAREVYRGLGEALRDPNDLLIRGAHIEVLGQLLIDPETKWPFVLTFYQLIVLNPPTPLS